MATADRPLAFQHTINSILAQNHLPAQVIIIDASVSKDTAGVVGTINWGSIIFTYEKAVKKGAGTQRNQAISFAAHQFIWFLDDDVILEPTCLEKMWNGMQMNDKMGGVNAMIKNQQYTAPGLITTIMYRLMSGQKLPTYSGKCIGPAWNLLPEDDPKLPELVRVDWLNTTCTMYRKAALPTPVFDTHFTGYSLMEDLTLSLRVGQKWELYNARTARIFHDSQPGSHKDNLSDLSKMELVNRYYVMSKVLHRTGLRYMIKLAIFEMFGIAGTLTSIQGVRQLPLVVLGKCRALAHLMKH